jgi:YHS domain-containing protein
VILVTGPAQLEAARPREDAFRPVTQVASGRPPLGYRRSHKEVPMRIECDACKAAVDKDSAVLRQDEDGEVFYFCAETCAETAERLDPDRGLERVDAPQRQEF